MSTEETNSFQQWLLTGEGDPPNEGDAGGTGDGINAPDAPPTPTPTDEQVREAAEALRMADVELQAPAPDNYVEGILKRLGLPVHPTVLEAVKAAARSGAPAKVPAEEPVVEPPVVPCELGSLEAGDMVEIDGVEFVAEEGETLETFAARINAAAGPGRAVVVPAEPPAEKPPKPSELYAAQVIAEKMRTSEPPTLSMKTKKAKAFAREVLGLKAMHGSRWQKIVAAAGVENLWILLDTPVHSVGIDAEEVESLTGNDLGWSSLQVASMSPAERMRVWEDDITSVGRHVTPSGEVQTVGGHGTPDNPNPPADAPRVSDQSDEVEPPPPADETGDLSGAPPVDDEGVPLSENFTPGEVETILAHETEQLGEDLADALGGPAPADDAPLYGYEGAAAEAEAANAARLDQLAEDMAVEVAVRARLFALPYRYLVLVGCLPIGVAVDMSLSVLLGPFERQAAVEAGVHYYLQEAGYRAGQRRVAGLLAEHLRAAAPEWRTLYVDPSHPCAVELLPVLAQLPGALVLRSTAVS